MGIERIEIEGFRSLKHVVWEPSNLNVLIGPNGSGKSNVLDALKLLSAAASGSFEELISKWRGFRPLTWNYACGPISCKMAYTTPADILPDSSLSGAHVDYRLVVGSPFEDGDYVVTEEGLKSAGEFEPLFFRDIGRETSVEAFLSKESRQPQLAARTKDVKRELLRQMISHWRIYQSIPVGRPSEIRRSVEARRIDIVDESGIDLVSALHTHYTEKPDFQEAIDDAMRAAFGTDFECLEFSPAEDTRILMRVHWRPLSQLQSATDLSDGIMRFLLLLTVLSAPVLPPVIAIDEPETGLHPSMLPIIAEYAMEASQKTQVILTTHSPEFLDAFSAADAVPKVTVAFWQDGQTVLKTPRRDVLDHWLKEYTLGRLMTSGELEEIAE